VKQILVYQPGGPEQLVLADVAVPTPPPSHALVAIHVAGVNFLDVYFRTGLYKSDRPIAIGSEAAGVVDAVGEGVGDLAPGDRVAYAMVRGSYAEYAVVPAVNLVKIPDAIGFEIAAAAFLQGATAHYLTRTTFPLNATHTCLVHAAAGGAGGLVVQMARAAGATVIGTAGSADKAREVTGLGADHAIVYTEQDFEAEVKRITDGRGVHVVYDSVGKATFEKGLKLLALAG
jgi:NADPH:quinone reductase